MSETPNNALIEAIAIESDNEGQFNITEAEWRKVRDDKENILSKITNNDKRSAFESKYAEIDASFQAEGEQIHKTTQNDLKVLRKVLNHTSSFSNFEVGSEVERSLDDLNEIGLDLNKLLESYNNYIDTELGALPYKYKIKIRKSISIKLGKIPEILSQAKADSKNEGEPLKNYRWIINEEITDLLDDINNKVLPSAKFITLSEKRIQKRLSPFGEMPSLNGVYSGPNITGGNGYLEEIKEMFNADVDENGDFNEGTLSIQDKIIDTSGEMGKSIAKFYDIKDIEGASLLNEDDKKLEGDMMIRYLAFVGTMLIPYAGAINSIPSDLTDAFSSKEGTIEIMKFYKLVPDEYNMSKHWIDNVFGIIGLIGTAFGAQALSKTKKGIKVLAKLEKMGIKGSELTSRISEQSKILKQKCFGGKEPTKADIKSIIKRNPENKNTFSYDTVKDNFSLSDAERKKEAVRMLEEKYPDEFNGFTDEQLDGIIEVHKIGEELFAKYLNENGLTSVDQLNNKQIREIFNSPEGRVALRQKMKALKELGIDKKYSSDLVRSGITGGGDISIKTNLIEGKTFKKGDVIEGEDINKINNVLENLVEGEKVIFDLPNGKILTIKKYAKTGALDYNAGGDITGTLGNISIHFSELGIWGGGNNKGFTRIRIKKGDGELKISKVSINNPKEIKKSNDKKLKLNKEETPKPIDDSPKVQTKVSKQTDNSPKVQTNIMGGKEYKPGDVIEGDEIKDLNKAIVDLKEGESIIINTPNGKEIELYKGVDEGEVKILYNHGDIKGGNASKLSEEKARTGISGNCSIKNGFGRISIKDGNGEIKVVRKSTKNIESGRLIEAGEDGLLKNYDILNDGTRDYMGLRLDKFLTNKVMGDLVETLKTRVNIFSSVQESKKSLRRLNSKLIEESGLPVPKENSRFYSVLKQSIKEGEFLRTFLYLDNPSQKDIDDVINFIQRTETGLAFKLNDDIKNLTPEMLNEIKKVLIRERVNYHDNMSIDKKMEFREAEENWLELGNDSNIKKVKDKAFSDNIVKDNFSLSDAERKKEAVRMLEEKYPDEFKGFTDEQLDGIIEVHKIGEELFAKYLNENGLTSVDQLNNKQIREIFNSPEGRVALRRKMKALKELGIDKKYSSDLVRSGITGGYIDNRKKTPYSSYRNLENKYDYEIIDICPREHRGNTGEELLIENIKKRKIVTKVLDDDGILPGFKLRLLSTLDSVSLESFMNINRTTMIRTTDIHNPTILTESNANMPDTYIRFSDGKVRKLFKSTVDNNGNIIYDCLSDGKFYGNGIDAS